MKTKKKIMNIYKKMKKKLKNLIHKNPNFEI